jgi:hypothetical protein
MKSGDVPETWAQTTRAGADAPHPAPRALRPRRPAPRPGPHRRAPAIARAAVPPAIARAAVPPALLPRLVADRRDHFAGRPAPERRRAEVGAEHREHPERDVDADPALARPVHVPQVEQQGELVDDERRADPVRQTEPGVVAGRVDDERRQPDRHQQPDPPDVMVQVRAADGQVAERADAVADGVCQQPEAAECHAEGHPGDEQRLVRAVPLVGVRMTEPPAEALAGLARCVVHRRRRGAQPRFCGPRSWPRTPSVRRRSFNPASWTCRRPPTSASRICRSAATNAE